MAVSQYDKEHLTSAQQAQIQAVTDAAQAGSMDWATAHSIAEGIRAQAAGGGYSGGQYGNEYKPVSSGSGGGNKANTYTGTDYHQDAIDAAREYAKQASSGGAGDWGAVLDALSMRDQKVDVIGTDYGRSSNDILQELYDLYYAPYQKQEMPTYGGSQWDSVLDQAAKELIGMNYDDWTQGEQYQALAERFGIQGKMNMQDVLGQISSRTGGLASSYATTAAQQQYNEYMSQLEEVARQMYSGDRSDLLENAQLSQSLADRDYNRYLDELEQYYAERDYKYQVGRDQISDSRYDQQYADANKAEAQERINAYLAAYGSVADLDAALVESSGYTQAELAALERYYAEQKAEAAKKNEGGNPIQKPALTAAQTLTALENGIVNESTKAAYEYYYGQPWEDEEASPEPEAEPGADATISNSHGDSWIYIPGHGRFSYQEVEKYVNSGQVIETYDASANTYTYKWNNNYK